MAFVCKWRFGLWENVNLLRISVLFGPNRVYLKKNLTIFMILFKQHPTLLQLHEAEVMLCYAQLC